MPLSSGHVCGIRSVAALICWGGKRAGEPDGLVCYYSSSLLQSLGTALHCYSKHGVTSFPWRAIGKVSVSHPPVSLSRSSVLFSGASVSLLTVFLFSLCWLCFYLLESSLFCSLLLPPCHFCSRLSGAVSCCHSSLGPCVQTSAALSDRLSAVTSQGYVKHETRKEVSRVARQRLRYVTRDLQMCH